MSRGGDGEDERGAEGGETEDDASEAANEEERGEDEGARARLRRVVDEGGGGGVAPEVVRVRERRGVPGRSVAGDVRAEGVEAREAHLLREDGGAARGRDRC